ncbi:MAG: lamin tail domain-containing protein [Prolixibacteraceae bacterium]|nr:lamin tail domain-containing protein [Prolixibacteraceae bacterium]
MKKQITLLAFLLIGQLLWAQPPNAWINEIHYDNTGSDVNEMVEIVIENPGSYTLGDFTLSLYNGNGGSFYQSITLNQFTTGDNINAFYIYSRYITGIQNGSPDGISLDYQGTLIQFLSYEGTFVAANGPANGVTSTDIGVNETGSTGTSESLQLGGNGTAYADFTWNVPATATPGSFNNGQSIGGISLPTILTAPSTLTGFLYQTGSGPSASQSFTVSGTNLTGDITITPPSAYEISTDDATFQSTDIVLPETGGLVAPTDIFVRLMAGLPVSPYNQNVMLLSPGATNKTVSCNGDVIPVMPQLVINEIHADPDAANGDANNDGVVDSSDDEFVEIVNNDTYPVDLSGYTLSDGIGVKHFFWGITLNPNEAIVVFGGGTPTGFETYALTAWGGSLGLNNSGDVVTLKDAASYVVDSYSYGSEGGDNQSLTRDPDLTGPFVQHTTASGSGGSLFSPGNHVDDSPFTLPPPAVPVHWMYSLLIFLVAGLAIVLKFKR